METFAAKAEMLINAPRDKVFSALTNKDELCQFWLNSASGDLALGATVQWTFMVPGVKDTVEVLDFDKDTYLRFRWSDGSDVEISFTERTLQSTRITVVVSGLSSVDQAIGTTEGFAIVLCDLKSLLETGKSGGMVRDAALLIAERLKSNQ